MQAQTKLRRLEADLHNSSVASEALQTEASDVEGKDELAYYQKTNELLRRQLQAHEQTAKDLQRKAADAESDVCGV